PRAGRLQRANGVGLSSGRGGAGGGGEGGRRRRAVGRRGGRGARPGGLGQRLLADVELVGAGERGAAGTGGEEQPESEEVPHCAGERSTLSAWRRARRRRPGRRP